LPPGELTVLLSVLLSIVWL